MEEIEVKGYITSIEPRVYRGFIEYRLKITPPRAKPEILYIREPPTWLEPGIPVKVKAVMSKQTKEHRYIVEEIEIVKDRPKIEPAEIIIEEISKEKLTIISGKKNGKLFSTTVNSEKILSKIQKPLPAKIYCILMKSEIESAFTEKEYKIIKKALEIAKKLEKEENDRETIFREQIES